MHRAIQEEAGLRAGLRRVVRRGGQPRRRARDTAREAKRSCSTKCRVARLTASGLSKRGIAETLVVARRTVETHLTSVYRKLEISSREELDAAMVRCGAVPGEASDGAAPG